MQLVLHTPGLLLKVRDGAFEVTAGEERRIVSPKQIDSIAVTAGCLISSAAVELAVRYDLAIYFFDEIGDAVGCLRSPYFESIATLRRKQVYFDDSPAAVEWVIGLFRQKTEGQLSVLAYLADRRPKLADDLKTTGDELQKALTELPDAEAPWETLSASLMAWEGAQARRYLKAVSPCLPEIWQFQRRSRRPAEDGFNAAMNYLYGMLYTIVEQAVFAAGLDPHLGILHSDQYDAPTLAFDLIEPFRPWVDRLLIEQFITHKVEPAFFEQRGGGWYLNSAGKRLFIPLFNDWLEERVRHGGKQTTRRLHIYAAAADLAKRINEFKSDI